MIALYTHSWSLFSMEFWKWLARRVLGKYTGPNAVEDSLIRGLKELQIDFKRNVRPKAEDSVIVLSGVRALHEAIKLKEAGAIKQLVAGPNVVTFPLDADRVFMNPAIDTILVPAKWVKDFWLQEAPGLAQKIAIFPSGVALTKASSRSGTPIIYDKLGDTELLKDILSIVGECRVFQYGSFARKDYLSALETAPYLIYLSQSESQGLALQESWMHNVPTFVNISTTWQSGKYRFTAENINAPYLIDDFGAFFKNSTDLKNYIAKAHTYSPRQQCIETLSDKVSVQTLLVKIQYEKNN